MQVMILVMDIGSTLIVMPLGIMLLIVLLGKLETA